MGVTAAEPTTYRAGSDGGLRLEFVPTAGLGLPPDASAPEPAAAPGAGDGAYVGVAARVFVTDDLTALIGVLEQVFDWSPVDVTAGRATFRFGWIRSGALEVVEPAAGTPEAAVLAAWGPGPFGIRLRVDGLGARADDLASRGTPFRRTTRDGVDVLLVDPARTCGTPFELVEA